MQPPLPFTLDTLTQAQRERLAFLETKAFFCGELMRADIENRFGIAPAASSRDLHAYRQLNPDQLTYDPTQRRYVPSEGFQPLFPFSAERILSWLSRGFGDGLGATQRKPLACEGFSQLINPDFDLLALITRAIYQGAALRVTYLSLSSGPSERVIVPGALADNGSRWHVRAYDRSRARFADFVLTRISRAVLLEEAPDASELLLADEQWSTEVELDLVPHPDLRYPAAVEADYSMRGGFLTVSMRAALAGYALSRWSVDCTPDHSLDPNRHHLWLVNNQSLQSVQSLVMAPGYSPNNRSNC